MLFAPPTRKHIQSPLGVLYTVDAQIGGASHTVYHSIYLLVGPSKGPGQFEAIIDAVHLGTCSLKSPNNIFKEN